MGDCVESRTVLGTFRKAKDYIREAGVIKKERELVRPALRGVSLTRFQFEKGCKCVYHQPRVARERSRAFQTRSPENLLGRNMGVCRVVSQKGSSR